MKTEKTEREKIKMEKMKREKIKRKKIKFTLILFIMFLSLMGISQQHLIFAESNLCELKIESDKINLRRKEKFSILIKLKPQKNLNLSAINMAIKFNDKNFKFKKAVISNGKKTNLKSRQINGEISLLFTDYDGMYFPDESETELFILDFIVNTDAEYSTNQITAEIFSAYDNSGNSVKFENNFSKFLNISPSDPSICEFLSLTPSEGELSPKFEPHLYNYTLDVLHDIKDIYFDFSLKNANCTVKINRHRLNAAGKITEIKITVSNKENGSVLVYNVKVNRAAKPSVEKKNNNEKEIKSKTEKRAEKSTNNNYDNEEYQEDSDENYDTDLNENSSEDISENDTKQVVPKSQRYHTESSNNDHISTMICATFFVLLFFVYSIIKIIKCFRCQKI